MRAARFLAILLLIAAIIAGAVYLLRLPLAGFAVRTALAQAGFDEAQARVTALDLQRVVIEDLSARASGVEAFRVETVSARYDWRRILADRMVDDIRVGPGAVRLSLDDRGRVSLPGVGSAPGARDGAVGALPFRRLTLVDMAIRIDAPKGAARALFNARYDFGAGGEATFTLASDALSVGGVDLSALDGAGAATLSADGSMNFTARASADLQSGGVRADAVAVEIDGGGGSWRDAAAGATDRLALAARIGFAAPDIALFGAAAAPVTNVRQLNFLFGDEIDRAALSGALDVRIDAGRFEARIPDDATIALTTPDGGGLTLAAQGAAPLASLSETREAASFRFALASDSVDLEGGMDFVVDAEGWRLAAPLEIDAYSSDAFAIERTALLIDARAAGPDRIEADVTVQSGVSKATIGRLTIADAPLSGAFAVDADLKAKSASVTNRRECLALDRLDARIAEMDLVADFSALSWCAPSGPILTLDWAGDLTARLAGAIAAERGAVRFGETTARGRPPMFDIAATYLPAQNRTEATGVISDGAVVLNDGLDLSDSEGRFSLTLDRDMLRADATLDSLKVAQHRTGGAPLYFAPTAAAGTASLAGDDARFSFVMTTPEGYRLGTGAGTHDMKTASGEMAFDFTGLRFAPGGLQPNRLFPALKGIIDAADGQAAGRLRFGWSPDGVVSGAEFSLDNVSFGGPTRAVTRTSSVSGAVSLSSLFPLRTDGLQTITVGAADLDALQLEDGVISFELPGDDTFRLARGEFPWFGGALGVYEATASMAGQAEIPLKATNVDLRQVLEYVNVNGLSGEGVLSGELPLIFEDGKARIVDGYLHSEGEGAIRYSGAATDQAAAAGQEAEIAFDILRDLRYRSMAVRVSGPLDGRLSFKIEFNGTGEVRVRNQPLVREGAGRVPVLYTITLDAALLELLQQANLSRDIQLQIQQGLAEEQ